ncbi:MAG: hypothetical protein M1813_008001 [Trichoglossum hirsutum]|nr:MAG: hypothetical protein M1813_008001 [Trichoglossum hirsutum]
MRPEDRFTADQCLQKACANGLFKRRVDVQGVNTDAPLEEDATEVATGVSTEIAVLNVNTLDDKSSDGGVATPMQQPSFPSSQSTQTKRSNTGLPTQRRRTSYTSNWSSTIGLGNSSSGGELDLDVGNSGDVAVGLFIRKHHFTTSLGR